MATRTQQNMKRICCQNISDIMEWFIILVIVLMAIFSEFIKIKPRNTFVPPDVALYSYPNMICSVDEIELLLMTLCPIYFCFILNVFILKISTYLMYESEVSALRNIEIYKNRNNKPNRLKLVDRLFDNKYDSKHVLSQFLSLTKCVFFTLGISHIITFIVKTYIASPRPYYYNYNGGEQGHALDSFPSSFAADSMSVNLLLFLCMIHSFQSLQSVYYKHCQQKEQQKEKEKAFNLTLIDNHCFNGNIYFGGNVWFLLRDIKILCILIICCPIILSLYIGLTQIVQYKHFAIDVFGGFCIGIFCAILTFNTFYNQLLNQRDIPSLSEMMEKMEESTMSSTSKIAHKDSLQKYTAPKSQIWRKRNFPKNTVINTENHINFPMTFGMDTNNDYNLRELEEMALQIGSNRNAAQILTDDDGIEIEQEIEEEIEEEFDDEITVSTEPNIMRHHHRSRSLGVEQRKYDLLNNHRKSIKISLPTSSRLSNFTQYSPKNNTMTISPLGASRYAE